MSCFNLPPFGGQPFHQQRPLSPTTHSDFTIEELPDEYQPDGLEVIHPYELEEEQSENNSIHKQQRHGSHETSSSDTDSSYESTDAEMSNPMRRLRCSPRQSQRGPAEPSSPASTASSRKRTFSQSTVADTDTEYESAATSETPSRIKRMRRQRRRGLDPRFQNHASSPPTSSSMPPDQGMDSVVPEDRMDIDSSASPNDAIA